MKIKALISLSFFIICFVCQSQNEESLILWNETYKLSWNDFRDKPDPNVDVVAITASGMTFKYSIKKSNDLIVGFTTEVETNFYPEKSWYKVERANAHILAHEQLHFDITELHSRKFRQQISLLSISEDLAKHLDALYIEIKNDLKGMQNLYDSETDYSRQVESQTRWQQQIDLELSNLSKFKTTN